MRRRYRTFRATLAGLLPVLLVATALGLALAAGAEAIEGVGSVAFEVFATTTAFGGLVFSLLVGFAYAKDLHGRHERKSERLRHESARKA